MTKNDVLRLIRGRQAIFLLFSGSRQLPYVRCHAESCLDYAEVYADEKQALSKAQAIAKADPRRKLRILKTDQQQRLRFFGECLALGLDAVNFVDTDGSSLMMPIEDIVKENPDAKDPAGRPLISNKTLQICLVYLSQQLALYSKPEEVEKETLLPLDEEAMKNLRQASLYVEMVPLKPSGGDAGAGDGAEKDGVTRFVPLVLLHKALNKKLIPVFADYHELTRGRQPGKNFSYRVFTYEELVNAFLRGDRVDGIVINPTGANLPIAADRARALLTDPRFV